MYFIFPKNRKISKNVIEIANEDKIIKVFIKKLDFYEV